MIKKLTSSLAYHTERKDNGKLKLNKSTEQSTSAKAVQWVTGEDLWWEGFVEKLALASRA